MNLEDARNIAIILGTAVALITLIKAVVEYTRQNAQKRAEHYSKLQERFQESDRYHDFFELLESDDPKLADLPFHRMQDFLGFYENIALLVNSGLLRKQVAHYMFSYYAIKCWDSKHFWSRMDRDAAYWRLFGYFVEQMKQVEQEFLANPSSVANYDL